MIIVRVKRCEVKWEPPLFVSWQCCSDLHSEFMLVKMFQYNQLVIMAVILYIQADAFKTKSFECGPYGFTCEGLSKLRLCEGENLLGPAFRCPPNTMCNEDSSEVCDDAVNYIDPELRRSLRCHRNERIADPNVPNCKGYILCIPNSNNRFQGIKFKCAGNTVFNGFTRTCSAPNKYKCPVNSATKPTLELYGNQNRRVDTGSLSKVDSTRGNRPIECKNYKFSVTNDEGPVRAAYFCPSRPVQGMNSIWCTVFSSKYCLTLERDDEDQFVQNVGLASRKPRM